MPETSINDWPYHKSVLHIFLQRLRHLTNDFSFFAARESVIREVKISITVVLRQLCEHKYTSLEKQTE